MPVKVQTLRVHPNPWIFIDHKGRPAGRVAVEQPKGHYDPRTVGSRIAEAKLITKANSDAMLAHDVHDIEIAYDSDPVRVANTTYYRRRIMCGDLIAADRESFVAAGGSPKVFESYLQHIETKKTQAITQFDAENGDGAFEALAAQREEEAKQAKAEAAAMAGEEHAPAPAPSSPTPPTATNADKKKGDEK